MSVCKLSAVFLSIVICYVHQVKGVTFQLTINTGTDRCAGSDGRIWMQIHGRSWTTDWLALDESSQTNIIKKVGMNVTDAGPNYKMSMRREPATYNCYWVNFVRSLTFHGNRRSDSYFFPCYCPTDKRQHGYPGVKYYITIYSDTVDNSITYFRLWVQFHGGGKDTGLREIHRLYAYGNVNNVKVSQFNAGPVLKRIKRRTCFTGCEQPQRHYDPAPPKCNKIAHCVTAKPCTTHLAPNGQCATCEKYYYPSGSSCQECHRISHCTVIKPCTSAYDLVCLTCEKGYYGPRCNVCPSIDNCTQEVCSTPADVTCEHCYDQSADISHSLYWPSDNKKLCLATCSWNKRWCWPGSCSDDLTSSCKCRRGFQKVDRGDVTKCELSVSPDLTTCSISIKDQHGQTARSTPGTITGCEYESNAYSKVNPNMLSFKLLATFVKKTDQSGPFPVYIHTTGTNTGIVSGTARVFMELLDGTHKPLQVISLNGGGDCKRSIDDRSPVSSMDCLISLNISHPLNNGERLCTYLKIFSGGFYDFLDFEGKRKGTEIFHRQPTDKTLCLKYDNVKPEHCSSSQSTPCNKLMIGLDRRITKTGKISLLIGDGWRDPWPKDGLPKHASSIRKFTLELHDVKTKGKVLEVDKGSLNPQIKEEILISMSRNVSFILPKAPALYCIMLEVHDHAGNVKFARRFVLFDNVTEIKISKTNLLRVSSASKMTGYTWQVNHALICLNWTDRYYNSYYINKNVLAVIEPDTANEITGNYDQETGKLPVSGTKSVNGLVDFIYSYSLNNGPFTPEKSVPEFLKQSVCLNLSLSDGDTYTFWITAEDVMENRLSENVTVHIDRTVPDIRNTWLVRNDNNELYIHHNVDLSEMVLKFEATDPHSGIHSMEWFLGTQLNLSDIGVGAVPVVKLPANKQCNASLHCYCPSVGDCAYFNYTVNLNSLVQKQTNIGKHNREYYFTLIATNGARLKSVYHLDILVDASPPVAGIVHEGPHGGPDIDYTSEDHIFINMHGFIDHESGIRFYLVGLAEHCLTLEELKNHKSSNKYSVHKTINPIIKLAFPNSGHFFSSVVAFNNAMEPSSVVCSDGITKDTTPPLMTDIRIRDGHMSRGLWCKDGKAFYVGKHMTLTELQQTHQCQKKCKHQVSIGYINALPLNGKAISDNDTSDNLCSKLSVLSNASVIYLPSDKIYLKWETNETESQIREYFVGIGNDPSQSDAPLLIHYESTHRKESFQLPHSGLTGRSLFYIFLKTINKAGLASVVILGPVIIDETPPQLNEKLYPRIKNNMVLITWSNESIKDPEESGNQFTVLYRVGVDNKYVTPLLQTPERILQRCQMNGFAGCIRYPLKSMQKLDSEQSLPFFFELHIYNTAGHYTSIKTEIIRIPSKFPPGNSTVFDITPIHQDGLRDVDFYNASQQACVYWTGLYHHHNTTFYVGIGQQPYHDDVIKFVKVEQNPACFNSSSLKPNKRYFTSVKAQCSGGTTVSSSDGFIIIDEKNSEYTVEVYDGIECSNTSTSTGHLYPLVKGNQLHGFKIEHLVVGVEHTLFLTNTQPHHANITMISHNVIIVRNDVVNSRSVTFIPTLPDIELMLDNPVSTSIANHGYVKQCTNDIEFQNSVFQYSMHWHTSGLLERYVTHFIIFLDHIVCKNASDNCVSEIASHTIPATERTYTWNKLSLPRNSLIKGNVQPCFENICLTTKSSNGIFVVDKPKMIYVHAEFTSELPNCTHASVTMDAVCNANQPAKTFQWYFAKERLGHQQLTQMTTLHQHLVGAVKQNVCISMPVHSYQDIYICAKVFCTSAFSEILCSPVTLKQDVHDYKPHMIYDFDSFTDYFERLSNWVKSQHLDKDSMKYLHTKDVNFVTSNTVIGGILTDTANRNVTWYLMTKDSVPLDCSSDQSCVSNLHTFGGVVNFKKVYLQNRRLYHICAHVPECVVNREFYKEKLDSFTGCSNGFVVDDDPPEPGTVTIIGQNNGFITEHTTLSVAWKSFSDVEKYINIPFISGIAGYSFALGTIPNSEDIVPFRNVGMATTGNLWNLTLTNGQVYYATVKAFDHLGHSTTSVSEGVLVDTTPPMRGSLNIEGLPFHQHVLPRRDFRIQWRGFEDPESGIATVRLAVGSLNHKYDTIIKKKYSDNFADVRGDRFVDGHQYRIRFEVTNRAGLSTIEHTSPFMVDASSPDIGIVRDGHSSEKKDVDYQKDTTTYHCHWIGFKDDHSNIASYKVGLGSNPFEADVEPLVTVGLRTNFTWVMPFISGKKYFAIVEACNRAGLCSKTSSNGLIMDNTPPLAGRVLAGHRQNHQHYIGHTSSLSGSWQGFEDPETGIVQFEWCLGYAPYNCNITSFESIQLADSFLKAGLHLPLSVPLYLTIRATNHVGLQSVSASDGFIVDNTIPRIIEQPHFIATNSYHKQNVSVQTDISLLHMSWKFEDLETPIVKHILTLKTHHESQVALIRKEIGAETSHILTFQKDNRLRNGDVYSLSVTACNQAGLCATAHSYDLLIDSTPPQLGGFTIPLTWQNVEKGNRTLTLVNLTWFGFSEAESEITEYQLMISRSYDGFELSEGIQHVSPSVHSEEQSVSVLLSDELHTGESIILSISGENSVGLITETNKITVSVIASDHVGSKGFLQIQRHSCDVDYCTNDCTCAIVGKTCEASKTVNSCVNVQQMDSNEFPDIKIINQARAGDNIQYTSSTSCLSAEWRTTKPNSLHKIKRFEWSMGLRDQQVGNEIFLRSDKIWRSTGKKQNITYCLPPDKSLHDGEEYTVYVRVWYSDAQYKQFESSPIMVDSTTPSIRRGRRVKDSDETCETDFDFVKRGRVITSCWDGVFQDSQSGIDSYLIQIGSSQYGSDVMKALNVGTNTNYSVSQHLLKPGTKYFVTIKAVNKAGLYTVAFSDGFVVDGEAPVAGVVFNTAEHVNQAAQSSLTSFGVSWHGFQDHHSAVVNYKVAVYKTSDILTKLFQIDVGFKNQIVLNKLSLVQGELYQASVTAVDYAGYVSATVMSSPVLVDSTPPIGFQCLNFSDIAFNITWNSTDQSRDKLQTNSLKATFDVLQNTFFKIHVTKLLQTEHFVSGMNIFFKVGDAFVPSKYILIDNATRIEAYYYFLASKTGSLDVEILSEEPERLSQADISVFSCDQLQQVDGARALAVQQIMPSVISICARVFDPETDLLRVKIGVGTTKGGFQIQPLKPTLLHFHELVETNVPHGTPVFVTVTVENSARLMSVFKSESLIADHTPPEISRAAASLIYPSSGSQDASVVVDVQWIVIDEESGVKSCWCALGHKPYSEHIHPWTLAGKITGCSLEVSKVYHHEEIYASVKCFNQIELQSSISVGPQVVLLQPPSSEKGKVMFLVKNEPPDTHRQVQSDTKQMQVAWFNIGNGRYTDTFLYHITAEGVPVTDWTNTSYNYAEVDFDFQDGVVYTAEVVAVDARQQKSYPIIGTVVVDSRPPVLTGSTIYALWKDNSAHLSWGMVFRHPRSALIYDVTIGSRKGQEDLLHEMNVDLTSRVVDVPSSTHSLHIVIRATADNGECVIYTTYISRSH